MHIQQPCKFLQIMEIINKLDCFLCIWLSKMSSVPCLKRAARSFSGIRCIENRRDFDTSGSGGTCGTFVLWLEQIVLPPHPFESGDWEYPAQVIQSPWMVAASATDHLS